MSVRERCIKFITVSVHEIRQRLPSNINTLEKISLLSVNNALYAIKEPLTPLLELLLTPADQISVIEGQCQNLTLIKWNESKNTVSFWSEVSRYRDASDCNPLKELAEFALSVLVLSHANADVERVFSQMAIVKTKLRNKMKTKMAKAILGVRAGLRRHDKCCYNYDIPPDVLRKFGTMQAYTVKETESPAVYLTAAASTYQREFHEDVDDPSHHLLL